MGLFNFGRSKKSKNAQAKADQIAFAQLMNGFGITTNEEARDRDYVELGYQKNPNVQSIVNQTQKAAGLVKWNAYVVDSKGNKTLADNRLLSNILYKPNSWMTWNDMVNELIGFYMLQGDMYLWGINGGGVNEGKYTSLWALPSQHTQIHADYTKLGGITGYSVDYYSNGAQQEMAFEDVLHIKNFNPEYDEDASFLYGQSPLRGAKRSLDINNLCLDTATAFLKNQGVRGLLYRKYDDNMEFDENQVRKLDRKFNNAHAGAPNANRVAAVDGDYGYLNLMSKTGDIELLQQYEMSTKDICKVYGFPPELLGVGKETYQNINESKKKLWNDVVIPMLTKLKDGLNCWLTPAYGDNVYIDFDLSHINPIQEDLLTRGKAIKEFSGQITINEARQMSGLPPVDNIGDVKGTDMFFFRQGVVGGEGDKNKPNDKENNK